MIYKKNSNRGGALLSVVIVMAIAGILGALAISIAYTNLPTIPKTIPNIVPSIIKVITLLIFSLLE